MDGQGGMMVASCSMCVGPWVTEMTGGRWDVHEVWLTESRIEV